MTTTAPDFSDLYITDVDGDLQPGIPGLSPTDAGTVVWFRRLVRTRREGELDVGAVAWLVARMLCTGGVLVWLAQERHLLDDGLRELFGECAVLVPEPWAGFLAWASAEGNLATLRDWPPYRSDEEREGPSVRPRAVRRAASRRRR